MIVIIKGGFTYKAEFLIKEKAYAKLLSAAETFGNYNAAAMLDLYIENEVHNLKGENEVHNLKGINNKYILKMLKESRISFRTFFPSNHVTLEVYGHESLVDIDPCLKEFWERYQNIAGQFAREFKLKTGILEFISGELDCSDIVDKEEE